MGDKKPFTKDGRIYGFAEVDIEMDYLYGIYQNIDNAEQMNDKLYLWDLYSVDRTSFTLNVNHSYYRGGFLLSI